MQPIGKVDFSSIITEGTPALVAVVTLVQYIIRITDAGCRTIPVAVYTVLRRILFQIVQTDIMRNTHQLIDCTVVTILRTVCCLRAAQRDFTVHRHPLIQFRTGIKVDIHTIQFFIGEYALAVRNTDRSTIMRSFRTVAHRYVMILRETGIEIILQFIAILGVSVCLTVPSLLLAAVKNRSPTARCRCSIFSTAIRTDLSLSVTGLLFQRFRYTAPGEITVITHTETGFLGTFLGCNKDNTVTGTRSVKSCRIRSFQHGNTFNVIRINVECCATTVYTTIEGSIAVIVIAERYTVYNPQRLVVVAQGRVTADGDFGRTAQAGSRGVHLKTCHLTLQCAGYRRVAGFIQFIALQFLNCITQHLLLALDTEGSNHNLLQ